MKFLLKAALFLFQVLANRVHLQRDFFFPGNCLSFAFELLKRDPFRAFGPVTFVNLAGNEKNFLILRRRCTILCTEIQLLPKYPILKYIVSMTQLTGFLYELRCAVFRD